MNGVAVLVDSLKNSEVFAFGPTPTSAELIRVDRRSNLGTKRNQNLQVGQPGVQGLLWQAENPLNRLEMIRLSLLVSV